MWPFKKRKFEFKRNIYLVVDSSSDRFGQIGVCNYISIGDFSGSGGRKGYYSLNFICGSEVIEDNYPNTKRVKSFRFAEDLNETLVELFGREGCKNLSQAGIERILSH